MSYIRGRKHPIAAALTLLAIPTALHAQTAPTADPEPKQRSEAVLPKVEVRSTAAEYKADAAASPKFTAPLVDTPQTIAVIRKEVLREQGATTLQEALRNTPGVTLLLGEGGNSNTKDNIFMRGFDSSGNIYSDGVRDLGSYVRDTFNTEQIEVLKGASGSEYGRGAASGSINMTTKRPWAEDFIEGGVSIGNEGRKRATADINYRLGETSAVRLNLMTQDSDVAGRDEVNNSGWGIAPSLAFGLGTHTRTTFSYIHTEQDNTPDGGVPTIGLKGYYNATLNNAGVSPKRVDRDNFYGSKRDYAEVEADQFTAEIEHDATASTTLRNTFRAGRSLFDQLLTSPTAVFSDTVDGVATVRPDPATWTATRGIHLRRQENVLVTNQTSVSSTLQLGGMEHSLSAGLEAIYERQTTPTLTGGGTMSPASLYHPGASDPVTGRDVGETGARSKGETSTIGLYAFDTIAFNEQWQVSGGLRIDRYWTENNNVAVATGTNPAGVPAGTLIATTIEDDDTLLTWKLGAVFKPLPNGSIYASVSTSQQPPGGSNFTLSATGNNINNPNQDPSKATNLELGTKWELFDNRLAVTAAIFDTTVENDLTRDVNGEIQQYGEKSVQGVELGVVGQITQNWSISAGLAKMETEVKEGTATQSGASLNWSPELTFTAWTTYELPFGLTIGGGARYIDSMVRSVSNTAQAATTNMLEVDSYWVFDAMAEYEVSKNLSLQLNVYNLTDKFYVAQLNNNGNRYIPGESRSALLSANLKF